MKKLSFLSIIIASVLLQGCQTMPSTGYDGLMNEREAKIQGYLYDIQSDIESHVTAMDAIYYELQVLDSNVTAERAKLKQEASEKRKTVHSIQTDINKLEAISRKYGNVRNDIGQKQRDLKDYKDPVVSSLKLNKDDLRTLKEVSSVTGESALNPKTPAIKINSPESLENHYRTKLGVGDLLLKIKAIH
jgi:DNA repair ATPase RecN